MEPHNRWQPRYSGESEKHKEERWWGAILAAWDLSEAKLLKVRNLNVYDDVSGVPENPRLCPEVPEGLLSSPEPHYPETKWEDSTCRQRLGALYLSFMDQNECLELVFEVTSGLRGYTGMGAGNS